METSVSLYELNRQIIKQQGPLKENDIKSKIDMAQEMINSLKRIFDARIVDANLSLGVRK